MTITSIFVGVYVLFNLYTELGRVSSLYPLLLLLSILDGPSRAGKSISADSLSYGS